MGLQTPDPQLDRHVTDALLDEFVDALCLGDRIRETGGQCPCLRGHLICRDLPLARQVPRPPSDAVPVGGVDLVGTIDKGTRIDAHARHNIPFGRHVDFGLERRHIMRLPPMSDHPILLFFRVLQRSLCSKSQCDGQGCPNCQDLQPCGDVLLEFERPRQVKQVSHLLFVFVFERRTRYQSRKRHRPALGVGVELEGLESSPVEELLLLDFGTLALRRCDGRVEPMNRDSGVVIDRGDVVLVDASGAEDLGAIEVMDARQGFGDDLNVEMFLLKNRVLSVFDVDCSRLGSARRERQRRAGKPRCGHDTSRPTDATDDVPRERHDPD